MSQNKALDAEPPIASFLKSTLVGGGPVNAGVRPESSVLMADRETASKSLQAKRRRLVTLTVFAIFTVIIAWDLMPYFEYRANANRIRQLISIGSDIDDAGPILRKNGFTFYDKHFSTVAEDTYWIDVDVANKPRPWTLTLLHLCGIRLYYHWVVIESGLDNKVRTIF